MTPEEFDKTAGHCKRWQARTLAVMRAVLVDGKGLTEAAAEQDMTPQQANLHRTRFLARAEEVRVAEFMKKVKPDDPTKSALKPHISALHLLRDQGYTVEQLVEYLETLDIKATPKLVRQVLKGPKS